MINLEWYRTFKAIYQHGNLTNAAKDLLISQPNVSIQLASLESYIGHKLFERLPRKLVPTEYGKLLYTQIVESVENLERVEVEFRKTALKRVKNLRIATPIEYAHNVLIKKLNTPDININLKFGQTQELKELLLRREVDFAILNQKVEDPKIVLEPLIIENFMILASPPYHTSDLEELIIKNNIEEIERWLLNQNWISYDTKLSIIRRFWLENFKKRPLIKPHYVIPDINIILEAVSLNYGITIASDLLATEKIKEGKLKVIWQGNYTTKNQLWLAYIADQVNSSNLIEKIKDLLSI